MCENQKAMTDAEMETVATDEPQLDEYYMDIAVGVLGVDYGAEDIVAILTKAADAPTSSVDGQANDDDDDASENESNSRDWAEADAETKQEVLVRANLFVGLYDQFARWQTVFTDEASYANGPSTLQHDPVTGYVHLVHPADECIIHFEAFQTLQAAMDAVTAVTKTYPNEAPPLEYARRGPASILDYMLDGDSDSDSDSEQGDTAVRPKELDPPLSGTRVNMSDLTCSSYGLRELLDELHFPFEQNVQILASRLMERLAKCKLPHWSCHSNPYAL